MNVWTSAVNLAVRLAEDTTDDTTFDANSVTPGVEGFIMTGVLALAVIGLGFVLVRRLRTNAYRQEVREQIDAELAGQDAAGDAGVAGASDGLGGADGADGPDASGDDATQK